MSDDGQRKNPSEPPFQRTDLWDGPALVGASWWREEMAERVDSASRRGVLIATAAGAGVLLAGGIGLFAAFQESELEVQTDALALQRELGWDIGAEAEPLPLGTSVGVPLDGAVLARLVADLAPRQARFKPLYVPTLFQSVTAAPTAPAPGARSLAKVLRAFETTPMQVAHQRGRALGSLFADAPAGRALLVDLPGPESVAFAAGLCAQAEPVFLFDSWPHPRGVVPAHLTLCAAATYTPTFLRGASQRPANAPPALVLDRNRLAPYRDASDRFDNRYVAKTPSAAFWRAEGITQLLYVVPSQSDAESDDVLHDLFLYVAAGLDVRLVAATDFQRSSAASGDDSAAGFYYGGDADTHLAFRHAYGWGTPSQRFRIPVNVSRGFAYRPTPRPTVFGAAGATPRSRPPAFGTVSTLRSSSSRSVTGVRMGRSGSFGRGGRAGG